jgi:hypothetical protein
MAGLLTLGLLLVGVGSALHTLTVLRISEAHRTSFVELLFKAGSLDFQYYFSLRKRCGGSTWPVWLMCVCWLSGLAVVVVALTRG